MSVRGTVIAAFLLLFGSSSLQAQPTNFQLSLNRKYGYAAFQQCRLDISVKEKFGSASLQCVPKKGNPPLPVQKALSDADVQSLTVLLVRAALFDGLPASGTDLTPIDGIFETLEVHMGGRVVVAVTSGNPTFVEVPARKQLLDLLKSIEKRISS